MYYPAVPGDGPSGKVFHLGGFNQPMFRMLERVIPFLNGPSLAAEWIELPDHPDCSLFFATELGCGVLSTKTKDWHWKLEGGMRLHAVSLGQIDGQPVALLGGMDGFVAAVKLTDGKLIRRQYMGSPVIDVSQQKNGTLVVATQANVQILDPDWKPRDSVIRQVKRMLTVSENQLLLCLADQTLELIEINHS